MRRTTRSGRNADIEMRWENIACRRKEWGFGLAMRREVSASDERSSRDAHCLRSRVFVSKFSHRQAIMLQNMMWLCIDINHRSVLNSRDGRRRD